MAKIIITRKSKMIGWSGDFTVLLDDVFVNKLKNGKTIEISTSIGEHKISFKFGAKLSVVNVKIEDESDNLNLYTSVNSGGGIDISYSEKVFSSAKKCVLCEEPEIKRWNDTFTPLGEVCPKCMKKLYSNKIINGVSRKKVANYSVEELRSICNIPNPKLKMNANENNGASSETMGIHCHHCGGTNIVPISETETKGKDFNAGDACCGYMLCGPLGLLFGATGKGKQTITTTYWICKDCGNKFKA